MQQAVYLVVGIKSSAVVRLFWLTVLHLWSVIDSNLAVATSNIPGENATGMSRSQLNSVIMNYLVTGTLHQ